MKPTAGDVEALSVTGGLIEWVFRHWYRQCWAVFNCAGDNDTGFKQMAIMFWVFTPIMPGSVISIIPGYTCRSSHQWWHTVRRRKKAFTATSNNNSTMTIRLIYGRCKQPTKLLNWTTIRDGICTASEILMVRLFLTVIMAISPLTRLQAGPSIRITATSLVLSGE